MKTKRELIKTISIVQGNLSYIESTGVINGTLLIEIERVMEEYRKIEIEKFLICAKEDNIINSVMFDKLKYRINK